MCRMMLRYCSLTPFFSAPTVATVSCLGMQMSIRLVGAPRASAVSASRLSAQLTMWCDGSTMKPPARSMSLCRPVAEPILMLPRSWTNTTIVGASNTSRERWTMLWNVALSSGFSSGIGIRPNLACRSLLRLAATMSTKSVTEAPSARNSLLGSTGRTSRMSQWAAWMRATSWIVCRAESLTTTGSIVPKPSPISTLMHVMADSDTASTL